jgi:hypothetical protein
MMSRQIIFYSQLQYSSEVSLSLSAKALKKLHETALALVVELEL